MKAQTNIPVELIPAFLLLAEELNISRAARRLQLSQPALTRKLRSLESNLGTQLFLRQSRGLALTATGRELKRNIGPAFETLVSAVAEIKNSKNTLNGQIVFGCFSEVGTHLIAPALFKFAKLHPEVSFDIRYLSEGDIVAGIANGSIHMGVANKAPEHEGIRSYKLLSEKIQIVTSARNPDLEKNPLPRFAGYRVADRLLTSFLKKLNSSSKASPEMVIAVNSHSAIIAAIKELNLYAALPHHSVSQSLREGDIRVASKKELLNEVHLILADSEFPERRMIELTKFLRLQLKNTEENRL